MNEYIIIIIFAEARIKNFDTRLISNLHIDNSSFLRKEPKTNVIIKVHNNFIIYPFRANLFFIHSLSLHIYAQIKKQ